MAELYVSDHPLVQHKLTSLRARDTGAEEFRRLVQELAALLTVEATRDLTTRAVEVETPLARCTGRRLTERIAVVPILRAGLGMVEGVLRLLPQAEVWHLGLYRDERSLTPVEYYNKLPAGSPPELVLVLDPMLATGGSAAAAAAALRRWGARRVKFLGILAAPEGVAALQRAHPEVPIYVCQIDERLNEKGYILPGLGDAGDRQFDTTGAAAPPRAARA